MRNISCEYKERHSVECNEYSKKIRKVSISGAAQDKNEQKKKCKLAKIVIRCIIDFKICFITHYLLQALKTRTSSVNKYSTKRGRKVRFCAHSTSSMGHSTRPYARTTQAYVTGTLVVSFISMIQMQACGAQANVYFCIYQGTLHTVINYYLILVDLMVYVCSVNTKVRESKRIAIALNIKRQKPISLASQHAHNMYHPNAHRTKDARKFLMCARGTFLMVQSNAIWQSGCNKSYK